MNTSTLKTIHNLHDVVTACGNVLRGHIEVNGREYTIEAELGNERPALDWVNIIDNDSRCEACIIDGKDVVSNGGEYVTGDWTDADWKAFNAFVFWTPEKN